LEEINPLEVLDEKEGKKDACYYKVKSRYKVWPSAYASGALVKCRKVGAKNWGNKTKRSVGGMTVKTNGCGAVMARHGGRKVKIY